MKLELRPTIDSDYPEIISWLSSLADAQLWGGPNMIYPLTTESLKRIMKPHLVDTYTMVDEAEMMMGTGQIYFKKPSRFHLARIMVNPSGRGRGYGRQLVNALMEKSWNVPEKYFTLNVNFGNDRARALYESLGFALAEAEAGSFSETSHFMKKVAG